MLEQAIKHNVFGGLLLLSITASAEGVIDFNPYISTSMNYDDNVFRFTTPDQAKASFGSSETSDLVKRLDLGLDMNLRLSRQLITLTSSVSESKYNRFDQLDNTAKFYRLAWDWRLGNHLFGTLAASDSESLAGFNEIRSSVRNIRTSKRQSASINWNLHPDWTLYGLREFGKIGNDQTNFEALNREDETHEVGVRYQNLSNTQVGFGYRQTVSNFPNRFGFAEAFFGKENTQKDMIVSLAWLPTQKTRLSARLSKVSLDFENLPQKEFDGFSKRLNVDYISSGKTSINMTVYEEISPIDDVLSTYVISKGFSVNPSWNITSKVLLRGGLGFEDREYAGFSFGDVGNRDDESILANLGLLYTPTDKSLVQLQYQGEDRVSNIPGQQYRFNSVNLSLRYNF